MAINTTFTTMALDYERKTDSKQIVLQCNLDTSAKGGASKVCFVDGDVLITKAQTASKQIKVNGRVGIKPVYVDKEGALRSFDYVSDFAEDIVDDDVVADMPVGVKASIVDFQSEITGDIIKIQTVVQLEPSVIVSGHYDCLTDAEGMLIRKSPCDLQKFEGVVSENVEVTEEYDSGVNISEILLFDTKASISRVRASGGNVSIEGNAVVNVVYKSENIVTQKNFVLPFSHEFALSGEDVNVDVRACVRDSKLIILGTEQENVLRIETVVGIEGFAFSHERCEVICDVFCPDCDVETTRLNMQYPCSVGQFCFEDRISGEAAVDDERDSVRKISGCAVTQNALTNVVAVDGGAVCEGLLTVGVIYEEENGAAASVEVELPYSIQFDSDGMDADSMLTGCVTACDLTCKVKRDRQIEIGARLCFCLCKTRAAALDAVATLEEGAARAADTSGITVYIAKKGQSMWDVAKTLGVPIDEITRQNSDLGDTMAGGERVVVYRELAM